MSGATIPPWPQLVQLRHELRDGTLTMEEFAASLYDVVARTGQRPLYEDPAKFFALTYATQAMRDIATAIAERLRGHSPKGVRQLEMTYGGGKTHTMVTLTHLVRDPSGLPDVDSVHEFTQAMGGGAPVSRVAAVCFDKIDDELGCPVPSPDGAMRALFQPWSIIAWQLAGAEGLRIMRQDNSDTERDTPPSDIVLENVLNLAAKQGFGVLILMDEVMTWVSRKAKAEATGDAFFAQWEFFLQALTQAVAKVPTCALMVSLLASEAKSDDTRDREILARMSSVLKRTEDESFLPVGREDVAEILRRRLLDPESTRDKARFKANAVAALTALVALDPDYAKGPAQRAVREKAFVEAFPFDPALMEVLYVKWTSGMPLFQRTRGVLQTFANALREAETWDTSPVAGVAVLLNASGKPNVGVALRELARVARTSQTEGNSQTWASILEKELDFAREIQLGHAGLQHRELEAAVVATFLHSQPPGMKATLADLKAMVGTGKPDRITLDTALQEWAAKSWFLDQADLASGGFKPDGVTPEIPKTWRMGDQPNLKQMHDEARQSRVLESAVEERLLELVRADGKLKGGAGPGSRFHMLPAGPGDVGDDGEFHFAVLGPSAASESGKPSAEAARFVSDTTGTDKPRVNRNAIVLGVPSSLGLGLARDRIRDHLAWKEVKVMLAGQGDDAGRAANLAAKLKMTADTMGQAVRQAWCVCVATAEDDSVKAFKVTLDDGKTLFDSIKADRDSRIKDTTLDADLMLPGSDYDLWRVEEPTQRVKILVGAFFERSKLPKILRRKELLDTLANGAEQGRFMLRLPRSDDTARTWWHERPDEQAMGEANLDAVQLGHATLDSLPVALLRPGILPGLDFTAGVKVVDLLAYFAGGHAVDVMQVVDGQSYPETIVIPRCPEAVLLPAIGLAVTAGHLWVTNGAMSFCGEDPPAGAIDKPAMLRAPPAPIPVPTLAPEALPDAWSNGAATALALHIAISAKLALPGVMLPWATLRTAATSALNARYLELVPGGTVTWPCEARNAATVAFRLPSKIGGGGQGGSGPMPSPGLWEPDAPSVMPPIARASLDSAGLTALADALMDLQGVVATYGVALVFDVSVEAIGLPTDARQALRDELAKVAKAFGETA